MTQVKNHLDFHNQKKKSMIIEHLIFQELNLTYDGCSSFAFTLDTVLS